MRICLECGTSFEHERSNSWKCAKCGFVPASQDEILLFSPELASQNDGFNPEIFKTLFQLEAGNFWFRARNKLILWLIQKYFSNAKDFLEVGCGTAFVLSAIEKKFPTFNMNGTEIYTEALALAQKRLKRTNLFQANACALPYKNEFDLIGSFDVLEHIQDDYLVLSRFHSSLKEGGGVLLTVPQHQFLWSEYDNMAKHVRRYTQKELLQKLNAAGFDVIRCGSFVSLLFPTMLLSRIQHKKGNDTGELEHDSLDDFRLNPIINWILEKVMDFERVLIKLGVDFPFGGSIFVLARKKSL